METKKQNLLKMLERLKGFWEMAEGLTRVVKSKKVTEEQIDGLINIIQDTILETKQKSNKYLLKNKEKNQKTQEELDIEKALDNI